MPVQQLQRIFRHVLIDSSENLQLVVQASPFAKSFLSEILNLQSTAQAQALFIFVRTSKSMRDFQITVYATLLTIFIAVNFILAILTIQLHLLFTATRLLHLTRELFW